MSVLANFAQAMRRRISAIGSTIRFHRDKWLHPMRHRRALSRLKGAARPRRIIVMCHGNMCRSPYLEAVLRRGLPELDITSAGLMGAGHPVPEHGQAIASRNGLDLSGHRSGVLKPDMLRHVDLVIAMDAWQAEFVSDSLSFPARKVIIASDLEPEFAGARVIEDPFKGPLEAFEASYARLDRCATSVIDALHSAD